MSENFAMPVALELEQSRRMAIPSVRRKLIHNTTTQNEYRPGELCYIPVETGANGAFMDTATTRLKMTVVVRNKNYFTDFINLPRCGWHAIIQEFGIEINNTLHELNRHYAECIELDMIKRGENRTPFNMTEENPWEPADGLAGKFSINFIKPSMVTLMGLPHNVRYKDFDTATPDVISQAYCLYSNKYAHESFGTKLPIEYDNTAIVPNTASVRPYHYYQFGGFKSSSFEVAQSFYDDRIQSERFLKRNYQLLTAATGEATAGFAYSAVAADNSVSGTTIGPDIYRDSNNKIIGGPTILTLGSYSKIAPSQSAAEITVYNVKYGQSVDCHPPGQWPAKQPTDLEKLNDKYRSQLRMVNCDNVMSYYANVQNIPVGIPLYLASGSDGHDEIWSDTIKDKSVVAPMNSELGQETIFHISLKVYSSLIGVLASKWFPELVVPTGRMRLRLRFQEPNILFQLGTDPCRRIPGTPRDWYPNLGVTSTSWTDSANTAQACTVGTLTQGNPAIISSGVHAIMISNYEKGQCFNSAIAMGKFVLPQMKFLPTNELAKAFHIASYNGTAASQGDPLNSLVVDSQPPFYAANNVTFNAFLAALSNGTASAVGPPAVNSTPSVGIRNIAILLPKLFGSLENNLVIGNAPTNYQSYSAIGKPTPVANQKLIKTRNTESAASYDALQILHLQNYSTPTNWQHLVAAGSSEIVNGTTRVGVGTSLDVNTVKWTPDQTWDWEYKNQCWNPFCVPTSQYLPMLRASDKTLTRSINTTDFVDESQIFFGTHLSKSKAQVRRSFGPLYSLNIADQYKYGLFERLTYIVRDVQLESEQIVLPRAAALSIVENALSGGITMETKTWKEMESMMPKAKSQKHLINMAAAYCTSLSFIFRPSDVYQGDLAYGYDSFSYYNPFTSFDYKETDSQARAPYNSLGGEPVYNNAFVVSERVPIDLQLQLASELLPRFPISTVSDLILNCRWGDQCFDDRDYMELDPRMQPSHQVTKGQTINTLQDGFWSCFVPIYALDDQSITSNPFFTSAEISLGKKLRGSRHELGPLPIYKPYKGTFHISFNLEAYMGQSGRLRTGIPIVNNNMFLKFESAYLLEAYHTQLLTIAECDAKIVFERGGTMQFFT